MDADTLKLVCQYTVHGLLKVEEMLESGARAVRLGVPLAHALPVFAWLRAGMAALHLEGLVIELGPVCPETDVRYIEFGWLGPLRGGGGKPGGGGNGETGSEK